MSTQTEIIASREESTMVSSWTEYLCLTPIAGSRYRLFTGQYECLAERTAYYNEETEDYDLPDEIDGKAVYGIEDDYVVGGELQYFEIEQAVEFSSPDESIVGDWMEDNGWSSLATLNDIRLKLTTLQSAPN